MIPDDTLVADATSPVQVSLVGAREEKDEIRLLSTCARSMIIQDSRPVSPHSFFSWNLQQATALGGCVMTISHPQYQ